MDPLGRAIDGVIRAGRRLGSRGLISAGEGNLSVRLDADRLLVTPDGAAQGRADTRRPGRRLARPPRSRGASAGAATARARTSPSTSPSIAARPDIGAVAHAHLPAAMSLTLAGEVPDPAALPETALLLPRLPFLPSACPAARARADGSRRRCPTARAARAAVLLERHGAVRSGATRRHAVDRLELVEVLCRTWRDALLIRAARAALAMVDAVGTQPRVATEEGR